VINVLIAHVVTELNAYVKLRSGVADRVVAGTLMTVEAKANPQLNDKVAAVVVNVEEDRVYKSVETITKKPDGTGQVGRPEIRLKLYLLFAANLNVYNEALKALGYVVTFFQHRDIFEYASIAALSGVTGRMVFELHSLTFEQQNHLWGAMGAKYLPSVLYKVGVVTIREDLAEAEVPPVSDLAATGGNR
jgi:hypothetical protein